MTRRPKVWLVVALLFTVVNLAGGVVAALEGEPLHAGVHALLTLLGAYFVWRLVARPDARDVSGEFSDHLTHLEHSVDAVALEVERIGEGQRFLTRLFTENGIPRPAERGAAEPAELEAPAPAPQGRGS